ncbi:MAG: hypothetical protein ACRDOU_28180 [Streptosporangiaceae bacterium]
MATITVPRTGVSTEDVSKVLRQGLSSRYKVLPDEAVTLNAVGKPQPNHPDTIIVGIGSARLLRAQVKISSGPDATTLHVTPGGLTVLWRMTNRLWFVRKVRRVLAASASLH